MDDQIQKKVKIQQDNNTLLQSEAQRIFNQYSHIPKDEQKFQVFNYFTQQLNSYMKRMDEHRQILKQQSDLQIKICQNNLQLQRAKFEYQQLEKKNSKKK
ncbi:hypothetical protein pb186bvf_016926 [Paramecium bursaria]